MHELSCVVVLQRPMLQIAAAGGFGIGSNSDTLRITVSSLPLRNPAHQSPRLDAKRVTQVGEQVLTAPIFVWANLYVPMVQMAFDEQLDGVKMSTVRVSLATALAIFCMISQTGHLWRCGAAGLVQQQSAAGSAAPGRDRACGRDGSGRGGRRVHLLRTAQRQQWRPSSPLGRVSPACCAVVSC